MIHGVDLSQLVLDQLRLAGINPGWCTHHELAAAQQGAVVDCDVFDEDDGDNFYDNLELDTEEIAAREKSFAPPLTSVPSVIDTSTFCGRLERERLSQKEGGDLHAIIIGCP